MLEMYFNTTAWYKQSYSARWPRQHIWRSSKSVRCASPSPRESILPSSNRSTMSDPIISLPLVHFFINTRNSRIETSWTDETCKTAILIFSLPHFRPERKSENCSVVRNIYSFKNQSRMFSVQWLLSGIRRSVSACCVSIDEQRSFCRG